MTTFAVCLVINYSENNAQIQQQARRAESAGHLGILDPHRMARRAMKCALNNQRGGWFGVKVLLRRFGIRGGNLNVENHARRGEEAKKLRGSVIVSSRIETLLPQKSFQCVGVSFNFKERQIHPWVKDGLHKNPAPVFSRHCGEARQIDPATDSLIAGPQPRRLKL